MTTREEKCRDWRHANLPADGPTDYWAEQAFIAGFEAAKSEMKLTAKERGYIHGLRLLYAEGQVTGPIRGRGDLIYLLNLVDRLTSTAREVIK